MGSVLGLVVGDALGAPFEFKRAHEIPDPIPAFELPWFGFPPGTWTDDTELARNLWQSLLEHEGRLDPVDVVRRHLAWLATSPRDVGSITRRVLSWTADGVEDAAHRYVTERGPEMSAGNGSVMYCAPLGVVSAFRPEELLSTAPRMSAITHWDERCRTGCLAVTTAIAALVRGEGGEEAVRSALKVVAERAGGEELEYLVGAAGIERPIDGPDQGFVFFTTGVGLRVVGEERGFEEGLREVIALGGDTDTNASVAGALLGALHGVDGIPEPWLELIAESREIRLEAQAVAALAAAGQG
jgi:ADP-ribosyl-[dinitrogen reductase] hydrolase